MTMTVGNSLLQMSASQLVKNSSRLSLGKDKSKKVFKRYESLT